MSTSRFNRSPRVFLFNGKTVLLLLLLLNLALKKCRSFVTPITSPAASAANQYSNPNRIISHETSSSSSPPPPPARLATLRHVMPATTSTITPPKRERGRATRRISTAYFGLVTTTTRLMAKPPSLLDEDTTATISSSSQTLSSTEANPTAAAAAAAPPPPPAAEVENAKERGIQGEENDEIIPAGTVQPKEEEEEEEDPILLTRRQWLRQCGLVGGSLAASAFISQQKDLKRQEEERKAFIRLEPYPHRKRNDKQQPPTPQQKNIGISNATAMFNATTSNPAAKNATAATKATSGGSTNKTTTTTSTSAANKTTATTTTKPKASNATSTANKELAPVNFTKVAAENTINITLKSCDGGCVKINGTTLQKVQTPTRQLPWFVPKFLQPTPKVLKDIPDNEVLFAATVAGSIIEMGRTTLLYPLATVKTRIQTRQQEQRKVKLQRSRRRGTTLRVNTTNSNSSSVLKISAPKKKKKKKNTTTMSNITTTTREDVEKTGSDDDTTTTEHRKTMAAVGTDAEASHNATTTTTTDPSTTTHISSSLASAATTITTPTKRRTSRSISRTQKNARQLRRRLRVLRLNVKRHVAEGNLYAGLVPSLLVSVPATGVYYGVRDVTKRMLVMSASSGIVPGGAGGLNDAAITLVGAFVADVVSLMVRTPADALAARLQAVAAAEKSRKRSKKTTASSVDDTIQQGQAVLNETSGLLNATTTVGQPDHQETTNGRSHQISATSDTTDPTMTEQPPLKPWSAGMGDAYDDDDFEVDEEDEEEYVDDTNAFTMSALDLAFEALLREEEEHYQQRETNLIVDKTNANNDTYTFWASGGLSSSSSPYNNERNLLLQLPCYYDINVQNLYDGVGLEEAGTSASSRVLTAKQFKRNQRKMQKKRLKKIAKCEARNAWLNTPPQHLYTLEFLEGLQEEEANNGATIWSESTLTNVTMMNAGVTEWDKPLWNLVDIAREQLTLLAQRKKNETADSQQEGAEEHTEVAKNDTAATSQQQQQQQGKDDNEGDDSIRMAEKEERELLKELQEESIYQEDWFRQSLERLPAIIITDLPYLLSRIALNRIIIHGTVNIGQYEVATIGIAIVCALITTPFDVVRTRLLVENDDQDIVAPCDDASAIVAAAANTTGTTTAVVDGNIVLLNNFTDAGALAQDGETNTNNPDYLKEGVLRTMICIAKEGDGGVRNLYAGWLERTLYFGIGRAWLDPINIITYIGIRDTLLLKLFD